MLFRPSATWSSQRAALFKVRAQTTRSSSLSNFTPTQSTSTAAQPTHPLPKPTPSSTLGSTSCRRRPTLLRHTRCFGTTTSSCRWRSTQMALTTSTVDWRRPSLACCKNQYLGNSFERYTCLWYRCHTLSPTPTHATLPMGNSTWRRLCSTAQCLSSKSQISVHGWHSAWITNWSRIASHKISANWHKSKNIGLQRVRTYSLLVRPSMTSCSTKWTKAKESSRKLYSEAGWTIHPN